jgi:hypothetical protein
VPAVLIFSLTWLLGAVLRGLSQAAKGWKAEIPTLLALALIARFAYKVYQLALTVPKQLAAGLFSLPEDGMLLFALGALLALAATWLLHQRKPLAGENGRGMLLALLLFAVYFVLANVFNRLDFNNNNVFFAADSHQWQLRLADDDGPFMEMRAIHPLGFFLRPAVYALALVLATEPFNALLILLATTGAGTIYLSWLIIAKQTGNQTHATLFAAIFGVSTASLVFNSISETYIFSAFFLVLFFYLLQRQARLGWLIAAGIATFGVTISNLVQVGLGLFISQPKWKRSALFAAAVIGAAAVLSLLGKQLYPNSAYFFNPADYAVEEQHYQTAEEDGGLAARAKLVATDIFAFSVAAPQPFLQIYNKDGRDQFPKFNMMQGERLARYVGLGQPAAWLWLGVFAAGLVFFVRTWRHEGLTPDVRLCIAFLLCLLFNFAFHLVYGFEPFLYAADWTYALILFAAIALRPAAASRWLQGALLVLLALLTLNNLTFLYFLMNGWAPLLPN